MRNSKMPSLQIKTALAVVMAFIVGVSTFIVLQNTGKGLINRLYMSEQKCKERKTQYIYRFKAYAEDNHLESKDTQAIKKWCNRQHYVYLFIYKGNKLLYETDGSFIETYDVSDSNDQLDSELCPVRFVDGIYGITIAEFTESRYFNYVEVLSAFIGFITLIAIVLWYNNHIVSRIIMLSNSVRRIIDGDSYSKIIIPGNDELSRLGYDINEMYSSITKHYEGEKEALRANNELLTSISHDIRTPLTSLMVYTDALAGNQVEKREDIIRYASVCSDKVHQLKDLTDALFRYFLVYGNQNIELKSEEYNASVLMQQLLGEHMVFLQQKGYKISFSELKDDCLILTDVSMLKRVYDNVFSNIEKYADKDRNIDVKNELYGNSLKVTITNYCKATKEKPESTRIGLKTCEKIMNILGGDFSYKNHSNVFEVTITINTKGLK